MALINRNRLFVDVELNRAYSQFGSFSTALQPFFIQGDQCPVEISLVRQTGVQGNPFEQVPFDPSSTFSLKIGNTTLVATSTNTATTPSAPAVTLKPLAAPISVMTCSPLRSGVPSANVVSSLASTVITPGVGPCHGPAPRCTAMTLAPACAANCTAA